MTGNGTVQVYLQTIQQRVSDDDWKQARASLLSYFWCHRVGNPDDLVQETLTRVLEWLTKGNLIDGESGFQKLCFGFARNVRRESEEKRNKTEPLDFDICAATSKTFGLNSRESGILVGQLLGQLSPGDRQLLIAVEIMNPKVVALRMGTSLPRLNVKLFRARRRLRKLLSRYRTPSTESRLGGTKRPRPGKHQAGDY